MCPCWNKGLFAKVNVQQPATSVDRKGIVAKDHLASASISFPSGDSPFLPAVGSYSGGETPGVTPTSTVQKNSTSPEQRVDDLWVMQGAPRITPHLFKFSYRKRKYELARHFKTLPQLHIVFVPITKERSSRNLVMVYRIRSHFIELYAHT